MNQLFKARNGDSYIYRVVERTQEEMILFSLHEHGPLAAEGMTWRGTPSQFLLLFIPYRP